MKRSPMPPRKAPMKRVPGPRSRGIANAVAKHPASGDLARNRELAFKRDRWTCRLLGVVGHECGGTLHAHHIVLRSQGGTHDVDNLASLCPNAHRWVHDHPAEANRLGLYGRRTENTE